MRGDIAKDTSDEVLKPATDLRIKPEEEKEFDQGCVFEKPEILTLGHVLRQSRISKIEMRAVYSDYLVMPTKFSFIKVVRIYANVIKFVKRCSQNKRILQFLLSEANIQFSVFST